MSYYEPIREIWSRVLDQSDLNAETNFFEVGGDSLTMMEMLFALEQSFNIDISPEVIFENPTLGLFCERVQEKIGADPA